jgi:hypothetical protein
MSQIRASKYHHRGLPVMQLLLLGVLRPLETIVKNGAGHERGVEPVRVDARRRRI